VDNVLERTGFFLPFQLEPVNLESDVNHDVVRASRVIRNRRHVTRPYRIQLELIYGIRLLIEHTQNAIYCILRLVVTMLRAVSTAVFNPVVDRLGADLDRRSSHGERGLKPDR
jgi:hypothetical protein